MMRSDGHREGLQSKHQQRLILCSKQGVGAFVIVDFGKPDPDPGQLNCKGRLSESETSRLPSDSSHALPV